MKRKIIFWIIFGASLYTAVPIVCITLLFWNPILTRKMVDYYSNDKNYFQYEATISRFSKKDGEAAIQLASIRYIDEGAPTAEGNSNWARVFSPDLDATWNAFLPEIGLRFKFIGNLRIFYNGGEGAIVSITVRGETILSFENGKAALLEWAKQMR